MIDAPFVARNDEPERSPSRSTNADLWMLRLQTVLAFSLSVALIALDGTTVRGVALVLGGLSILLVIASLVSNEFPIWLPGTILVGTAMIAVFSNDDFAFLALLSFAATVAGVELATACEHARHDQGMLAPRFDRIHLLLLLGPATCAGFMTAFLGIILPVGRFWTLAGVASLGLLAIAFEARRRRIPAATLPPPAVDRAY